MFLFIEVITYHVIEPKLDEKACLTHFLSPVLLEVNRCALIFCVVNRHAKSISADDVSFQ